MGQRVLALHQYFHPSVEYIYASIYEVILMHAVAKREGIVSAVFFDIKGIVSALFFG